MVQSVSASSREDPLESDELFFGRWPVLVQQGGPVLRRTDEKIMVLMGADIRELLFHGVESLWFHPRKCFFQRMCDHICISCSEGSISASPS
ncbi:hypothetical protein NNX39_02595 [Arthrobacter sp. zg-Y826]|nr:hypothetical protein [Arthrobacter jinronghuae]MCQ1955395.1 hypothetical protein [Arthrobacter jinronghuae]